MDEQPKRMLILAEDHRRSELERAVAWVRERNADTKAWMYSPATQLSTEMYVAPRPSFLVDIPEIFPRENIESCLRSTPYAAIAIDGKMGQYVNSLKRDSRDWVIKGEERLAHELMRNLQEGAYGALNQQTPVLNMSPCYEVPGSTEDPYLCSQSTRAESLVSAAYDAFLCPGGEYQWRKKNTVPAASRAGKPVKE